jgi:purine-binding chemotaxis protein CheW
MAIRRRVAPPQRSLTAVAFFLGNEECAFPITDVHQILKEARVTPVPNVNRYVEGVFNLRGLVIPVMDLRFVLGLGVRRRSEQERLVIVDVNRRLVGFSVDAVAGVKSFDERLVKPAPEVVLSHMVGRFVAGVVQREQGVVVLLNTREVIKVRKVERSGGNAGAGAQLRPPA